MSDPNPIVTLGFPDDIFIGEPFNLEVTFENQAPSVIGFVPAYTLILPQEVELTGETPLATWDNTTMQWLDSSNNPITGYPDFEYLLLPTTGINDGDKLYNFIIPYSSYGPNQRPLTYNFETNIIDPSFVEGNTYDYTAYGIFFLGKDATVNPIIDPPITQDPFSVVPVEPQRVKITKTIINRPPGNAIPTGPNFPITFEINTHVAPNQTITDGEIKDALDPALRYIYGSSNI